MGRNIRLWLITAIGFIFIGTIILVGAMLLLKWDFMKFSTVKFQTNTYEINNRFHNISLNADTADISFIPSEDSCCKVVCFEKTNLKHSVTAENGTLNIHKADERKWYEHIGINFRSPKITVYLPAGEYGRLTIQTDTSDTKIAKDFKFESIDITQSTGDLISYASAVESIQIKASTGRITTEGISAKAIHLSTSTGTITASDIICEGDIATKVSTGKTNLTNITCKNLLSDGNTGDAVLNNVIAVEKFSIKRSTGDIKLDGCDAAEIFIITDTGDVRGTLLSDKVFIAQTDTGHVDVPKSVSGGRCEITTDTGNIKIAID